MDYTISTEEKIKISFYEKLPSRNLVFATFIVILGSSFHIGYNGALLNVPHEKLAMRITNILINRGSQHLAESAMMEGTWYINNSCSYRQI
ncbi:hypothetical protein WA026_003605 [Henosepilachna vigintioctopunctata]|uniref:Uncharacterized protein n=1 Tax=Henosepilachna vigintioctopunctata TaxID=420089 RepID=A0AAW1TIM7_9CUCU